MPRKPANPKPETAKKTTRKKKVEEAVVEAAVADTPAAEKPVKKRGRKPAAKKTEPVLSTFVQVGDAEYDISDIAAKAYKAYKSTHKRKAVTEFRVYVKPEEGVAYFTVNGEGSPDFKINL